MSATGYLIDATTRHAIFVERYGHGRYNDLEPILNDMRDKLVARLSREDLTDFQFVRAQALLADVDDILAGSFQQFELDLGGYIEEFAEYEAGFNYRMLQGAVKVEVDIPAIEQVNAALNNTSMVLTQDNGAEQRLTIQQAIEQFSAKKSQEVRSLIQQGLIGGETTDDITRQVINSVERKINKTVKAQARSLVSTTISAASNQAHNQTARANSDVLRGEQIIATLDSHTSDICISADKTIWPVDEGPFPPLHWNSCAKDTKVRTNRGQISIQDVKVGDYAITHNGHYKRVYAVMAKPFDSKMFELVDNFGKRVRLTDSHPVLTINGWKKVRDIKAGDKIFNYSKKLFTFYHWFIGSLVEEQVLINSHNSKTEAAEEFVSYSVGSFSTGMSSAVKLDDDITTNKKVSNVFLKPWLKLKRVIGLG